jgi:prevent-host-death family protein
MPQSKRKGSTRTAEAKVSSRKPPQKWQLQTAKAKFSEVFRLAMTEGPQHVTKQGKEEVVVLSKADFDRLKKPEPKQESLWEFLRKSPLVGSGINLERKKEYPRKIEL